MHGSSLPLMAINSLLAKGYPVYVVVYDAIESSYLQSQKKEFQWSNM